jgi:metal-responsive CopG/Arc/MetJ family transcriptional regulator
MTGIRNQAYGVVLPPDVASQARIVAAMQGKSRSSLMRELLIEYLDKCRDEAQAGRHVGQTAPACSPSAQRRDMASGLVREVPHAH